MGDEVSLRTRTVFAEALKSRLVRLDDSLEQEKRNNPFLEGVESIIEAIGSGKIECRVYRRDKFHAKAYITHARCDLLGAQALVGSSNFTRAGLMKNIELNIRIQDGHEIEQLQDWFEMHWAAAEDISDEVLRTISRHTAKVSPFEVYAKALHEYVRGGELTAGEWDQFQSKMFNNLDQYQKEAYWSLMKIARQHGGAFLCDGVGLGKTFVGLMLIERLVLHENKRVVLFAPKATREGVWEPHLREWLPHIGGVSGAADFSNLSVFSHTDLSRTGDFPERFRRISELADAVIIDEAHHFRNRGSRGIAAVDGRDHRSRYYRLFDLLNSEVRPKLVYLLTATPVNNRLADFRHMAELFTRGDDAHFAGTLGVSSLSGHFNAMERKVQGMLGNGAAFTAGHADSANDVLSEDDVFKALVVQRSRSYAKASQVQERGESAIFPDRNPPRVAGYSIRPSYRKVLDLFEQAFRREHPLFTLAIYYPLAYYTGSDDSIDVTEKNRQRQVVGLIRTLFLKRFESSVYAFQKSLDLLMRKLLAFIEANSETDAERERYSSWKHRHKSVINYRPEVQLGFQPRANDDPGADIEDSEAEEDVIPPELLEGAARLSRDEYDVPAVLDAVFSDLDQIKVFRNVTIRLTPEHDDKLIELTRLLRTKDLENRKVLVFTEFADTARYVASQLQRLGIQDVAQIDGGSTVNRAEIIRRFSPYYNSSSSADLALRGNSEIRVLVSTDVLSEGLNLQDATRLVNYDIHWSPVRLMQRIGRVDRRMNSQAEQRLVVDHPETEPDRGTIRYWNFLPPDELERILSLYERVTGKTLLISKTLGIEGRKLFTPEDDFDTLKEFNTTYEETTTAVEGIHLEYQALLRHNPGLAGRLDKLPGSVFSGRKKLRRGTKGVFFCYSLPALDADHSAFTLEAGPTRWYLYDLECDTILESPGEIIKSIRSKPNTPRRCTIDRMTLKDVRYKIERHLRDSYLKRVNAPLNAPNPRLRCWMELNE